MLFLRLARRRSHAALKTIIAHGTFDDGQETGPAGFVVLRNVGKHAGMQTYLLAPIGCTDPYWGDHLSKTPQVRACVMRSLKDPVPTGAELLRQWRVVADAGMEPNRDDFSSFGKLGFSVATVHSRGRGHNCFIIVHKMRKATSISVELCFQSHSIHFACSIRSTRKGNLGRFHRRKRPGYAKINATR